MAMMPATMVPWPTATLVRPSGTSRGGTPRVHQVDTRQVVALQRRMRERRAVFSRATMVPAHSRPGAPVFPGTKSTCE